MPIKIDGIPTRSSLTMVRDSGDRVQEADSDFTSELLEQEGNLSREQLEKLLKKIDAQGAKLSKTPTYDELKEYRTLIKAFITEAVGQMYELRSQSGWDRMGRQKAYTAVRKIDEQLEEMAEKIRVGQADQLDIIASHDAIRGMLVDLYM